MSAALLANLPAMSLEELRAAWATSLGREPPKLRTRELLALALAYRIQDQTIFPKASVEPP